MHLQNLQAVMPDKNGNPTILVRVYQTRRAARGMSPLSTLPPGQADRAFMIFSPITGMVYKNRRGRVGSFTIDDLEDEVECLYGITADTLKQAIKGRAKRA